MVETLFILGLISIIYFLTKIVRKNNIDKKTTPQLEKCDVVYQDEELSERKIIKIKSNAPDFQLNKIENYSDF